MPSIINATTTAGVAVTGDNSGALALQTNNGTTAVTIDTSQNVGVGTTSPAAPIDVVSNTSAIGISVRGRSDNAGVIRWMSNNGATVNGRIQVNSGGDMIFQNTNSITERMRIDSVGRVLIGTTDTNPVINNNSGVTINANTDNNFYNGVIQASSIGNAALLLNRAADDGTTAAFRRSGTAVGNISVTTSSTAYNTSSDYRLKENIAPMTGALAKVAQLKPCTYIWKVDGSNGQGFIAHELAEVVPQAVNGEKDAIDKDGNPEYQGVDTSFLVATLTAAIQELNAKVEAQAVRIAELEGAK